MPLVVSGALHTVTGLILVHITQRWDFYIPRALSSAHWAGSSIAHSRSCNLPGPVKAPQSGSLAIALSLQDNMTRNLQKTDDG